jgi:F-type H+-transporting ATPase subunit delta
MIPQAIIGRYGRSLADVAFSTGAEEEVTRDLDLFRNVFHAVPDLLEAFDSPAVSRDAKERILQELMELHPVSATSANFLRVLLDHNRLRFFHEIADQYLKTIDERKGILTARVTAPGPVSEEALARLRDTLSKVTGKSVALAVETDESLLGGFVIQIGSTVYDGSIRTQLAEMKQRLMA